jgi:hypothetical protein
VDTDVKAEDILEDPTKFGMPTFDEFRRSPEKYLGRDDERFSEVDRGSVLIQNLIQKHIYVIEGYRCKSLEEVERVAADMGIPIRELDYRPQIRPTGAGKCDVVVQFVPMREIQRRKRWS